MKRPGGKENGMTGKCKWLSDDFNEVCTNGDCPACSDFCPAVHHPGICKFMELEHAAWKTDSDRPDKLICPVCDHGFDVWKWDRQFMHFCPNCGNRIKVV